MVDPKTDPKGRNDKSIRDFTRQYPIWSNFIYFLASIYVLILSCTQRYPTRKHNVFFGLFGALILGTGICSIIYHYHTPSYINTLNVSKHQEKQYKSLLNVDTALALTLTVYGFLLLIVPIILFIPKYIRLAQVIPIWKRFVYFPLFRDPTFYLFVLFAILSIVFFLLGMHANQKALECDEDSCFSINIEGYNIFHSNWHIFTSITLIFFATIVHHAFRWPM